MKESIQERNPPKKGFGFGKFDQRRELIQVKRPSHAIIAVKFVFEDTYKLFMKKSNCFIATFVIIRKLQ